MIVIGRLTVTPGSGGPTSSRAVLPGEFTLNIAVRPPGFGYKLSAPAGILPEGLTSLGPDTIVGSWDINPSVAYFYGNPMKISNKLSVSA